MSKSDIDPVEAYLTLGYCAALVETMYPNYALFCQLLDLEGEKVYRSALDRVWEYASGRTEAIDFVKQQEKFQAFIPESDNVDFFGLRPALDACTGLVLLLQSCDVAQDDDLNSLVSLSSATIDYYLQAIACEGDYRAHPLFQRQAVLLENLDNALSLPGSDRRSSVDRIRRLVCNDDLSNIGISLQGE